MNENEIENYDNSDEKKTISNTLDLSSVGVGVIHCVSKYLGTETHSETNKKVTKNHSSSGANKKEIKSRDFARAKNRLREFSEKAVKELELEKVRTEAGPFGIFDHKVTGSELNRSIETIQEHFIAVNKTNTKVFEEFREVYNALDALDKDYMKSIIANVKSIEKTSNDVRTQQSILKQHNEKLANQQGELDVHQDEIKESVANISKIVAALNMFKEKLEGYRHIGDIDEIWDDFKIIKKDLQIHTNKLDKLTQTDDRMFESISANTHNINILNEYKEKLSGISHLKDVDSIWQDVEKHTYQFTECEKKDEELTVAIQKNKDEADKSVADVVQSTNSVFESLTKKIKYAYWIAGGSAGLAIIELILILTKVI